MKTLEQGKVKDANQKEDPEVKKMAVRSTQVKPPAEGRDQTPFEQFSSWFRFKEAPALAMQYDRIRARISSDAVATAALKRMQRPQWKI